MTGTLLAIAAAYVVMSILFLTASLTAPLKWWIKAAAIVVSSFFFVEIFFATKGGRVGTIDRATGASKLRTFPGEAIFNSMAADETGAVYVVTDHRLLALARAKCGADLAARVDVEDIVQSAFASFFRGAKQGFYAAPGGEELWNLLLVIALNKIRAQGAYHRAAKRDVRKTVGADTLADAGFDPPADDTAAAGLLGLVLEEVLGQLPEPHRDVVRLRIEGYEMPEFAARTGRSLRTTERVLQEFRSRMAAEFGEGSGNG